MNVSGFVLLLSRGGPPVIAMAVIGLASSVLFLVWSIVRYLSLWGDHREAAAVFGSRISDSPSIPRTTSNRYLRSLSPLLESGETASSGQERYDEVLSSGMKVAGRLTAADRIVPSMLTVFVGLIGALAVFGWAGKVHPTDLVGREIVDVIRESGVAPSECAAQISSALVSASVGLILLIPCLSAVVVSWSIVLLEGPRTIGPRLEWYAASLLERADTSNSPLWEARRRGLEERWARQWNWAAFYFFPVWLFARGFPGRGILVLLLAAASALVPLLAVLYLMAQFYVAVMGNRLLLRSRRRRGHPLF
ncbi:MAG: hypothetical protein ABIK65_05275 [Candidatus Eisenbacteria bacterium]